MKELRHAPAPARRGPHKTDETKNLPDATTATTSPRYSSHPPAKTPWRQRKKSQEIPYGGWLSAGRRDARLSQPRAPAAIDGGEPRHRGRRLSQLPGQPTEQNRRHGGRRRSRLETPNLHKAQRRRQSPALYPPKDLLQRDDLSLAFYEPYLELLCLLDG